jgi:DNA polymerase III subunit epsilon
MKPLLCFDIESTGKDPAKDRIVQFAWKTVGMVGGSEGSKCFLVNPGMPIPPESTEIHGITDEMVAESPRFEEHAPYLHGFIKKCDLLGFNLTNFDVPILWEEFYRAGICWDLSETRIMDAGTLFKKREERSLSAAVQFYCNRTHEAAHDAMGDVLATIAVWEAQLAKYKLDGLTRELQEKESNYDEKRVDLAGKIVIGKDGRPVYNIGKAKGVAVVDDPGFANWMLDRDFSANTKMHLMRILDEESSSVSSEVDAEGRPF